MAKRKAAASRGKRRASARSSASLQNRIDELEKTLQSIRSGRVDAPVATRPDRDHVSTPQGAAHPYRVLLEAMNEGAGTLDKDGTVLYANSRFAEILGVRLERLIGTALHSHVPLSEKERLQDLITAGSAESSKGEVTLRSAEGRRMLVQISLSPVRESDPATICVVATELTPLVEANEALKANEDALRQLSGRLLQLQDDERRRIARDLHDVTGQKLAFQAMALSSVLKGSGSVADPEVQQSLSECLALARDITGEIRTLSYLLHPPLLDELGLASAVRWYVEGFEKRTGIHVQVDIPVDFPRLGVEAETALFRIVQESLTNVHRYAGSPNAGVTVRTNGEEVVLQVWDTGKGMGPESGRSMRQGSGEVLGVGIQGMRERMRQLGGRLEISSPNDGGTLVAAIVPASESKGEVFAEFTEAMNAHGNENAQAPGTANAKKRILIADDHEVLRRGVRNMLEDKGEWEVCGEAVNGQDALEKTLFLSPDVLILDINMPELNGLAVLRKVLQSRPRTRVLIFTVHESEQMVQESLTAGAHGFLSKARAGQDLVRAVTALLAGEKFYAAIARGVL